MNPKTNEFENLNKLIKNISNETTSLLVRPNGEPVPEHWSVFQVGEEVLLKNYKFKVGYINQKTLVLEPVGIWEPKKDE